MKSHINFVASAFALTALSYGLARFAYGLLLPQIRAALAISVTSAGWIGGSAFAAYCIGIIFTLTGAGKLTSRSMALLAGITATVGMLLVALAMSGWMLGAGIALAGLSTGLTSPPLAFAVSSLFSSESRSQANATINAGTTAGIVFCGLSVLLVAGAWRELYFAFTLVGAATTLWLWFAFPRSLSRASASKMRWGILKRPGLGALCVSAFLMGLSSTAIWTFGAEILREKAHFSNAYIAFAWIVLGASGITGALTGVFTHRFGIKPVHVLALLAMAIATTGLATATLSPVYGFVAMGVFGAAYIISSGVYLIQGIELLPDRPDLGLGIPFLTLALGQAVGNPLFGALMNLGILSALSAFAGVACVALVIRP
jgi:predicted MFS family arabinose efflux permease